MSHLALPIVAALALAGGGPDETPAAQSPLLSARPPVSAQAAKRSVEGHTVVVYSPAESANPPVEDAPVEDDSEEPDAAEAAARTSAPEEPTWEAVLTGVLLWDDLVVVPLPSAMQADTPATFSFGQDDPGIVVAVDRRLGLALLIAPFRASIPLRTSSDALRSTGTIHAIHELPGLLTQAQIDFTPDVVDTDRWGVTYALPDRWRDVPEGAAVFRDRAFAGFVVTAGGGKVVWPAGPILDWVTKVSPRQAATTTRD